MQPAHADVLMQASREFDPEVLELSGQSARTAAVALAIGVDASGYAAD